MKKLLMYFFMVICIPFFAGHALAEDYSIIVNATPTSDYVVDVEIDTNLPDGAVLAVSLFLEALKDDEDIGIGTSFIRVPVTNGKASTVIDIEKESPNDLHRFVSGKYEVSVKFHSNQSWEENYQLGIGEDLEATELVDLTANGKGPDYLEALLKKEKGQLWVMYNVMPDMEWNLTEWGKRFGAFEQYAPAQGNPKILQMFYFPSIDMTLLVNVSKGEIVTFREGRADS